MGALAVDVVTSTRIVPWQPASTTASEGSIRIAKSARIRSGSLTARLAEAVELALDLLGLVEDVGDVADRLAARSRRAAG